MLSILIVNYNGSAHLEKCLQALAVQTLPREQFEVIVLDNASADDSFAIAQQRHPWCQFVKSPTNLGFAEGNNRAALHARGSTLVLLNNDTIPDPHWLQELDRMIQRHPGTAVVSKLVLTQQPDHLNSTGLMLLRDGRGADRGFREQDLGQYEQPEEVFAGCGAAVALPAPPRGVPIFDPCYFMYCEDLDEAWQAQLRGRPTIYAPRAVVRHSVGAAGNDGSPSYWYHAERNRALTAVKNADLFLALWVSLGFAARVGRAVMLMLLRNRAPKYRPVVVRALILSFASFLLRLPRTLTLRYDIRMTAQTGRRTGVSGCAY